MPKWYERLQQIKRTAAGSAINMTMYQPISTHRSPLKIQHQSQQTQTHQSIASVQNNNNQQYFNDDVSSSTATVSVTTNYSDKSSMNNFLLQDQKQRCEPPPYQLDPLFIDGPALLVRAILFELNAYHRWILLSRATYDRLWIKFNGDRALIHNYMVMHRNDPLIYETSNIVSGFNVKYNTLPTEVPLPFASSTMPATSVLSSPPISTTPNADLPLRKRKRLETQETPSIANPKITLPQQTPINAISTAINTNIRSTPKHLTRNQINELFAHYCATLNHQYEVQKILLIMDCRRFSFHQWFQTTNNTITSSTKHNTDCSVCANIRQHLMYLAMLRRRQLYPFLKAIVICDASASNLLPIDIASKNPISGALKRTISGDFKNGNVLPESSDIAAIIAVNSDPPHVVEIVQYLMQLTALEVNPMDDIIMYGLNVGEINRYILEHHRSVVVTSEDLETM